jgi:hypothetical protein
MRGYLGVGVRFTSAALVAALAALAAPAMALEEAKDEKDKLKACEANLCALVTKKGPASGDLACALSKTWARDKIKEGSASGRISWGCGDARCSVDLKLPRSAVVEALTKPESTMQFADHTVNCEIERE